MQEVPAKLDYARRATARHWPWWFHLLFAVGLGLPFISFIAVPMFSNANEQLIGIPSGPLMLGLIILAVAVFAELGWELHKWYARVTLPLEPDEQMILDLLREVYQGYVLTIVQRPGGTSVKFGTNQGVGVAVNLTGIADDYRRGKSPNSIKAEMQTWPR